MTRPPDLPDFNAPPVIEVVVGVQFPTIDELCTAHVGAFWQRMRAEYPGVQDMPPLPAVYESSGKGPEGLEVSLLPLRRSSSSATTEPGSFSYRAIAYFTTGGSSPTPKRTLGTKRALIDFRPSGGSIENFWRRRRCRCRPSIS